MMEDAMRRSRFKDFPQAGEEPYCPFPGLPLLDRCRLQGVLVVQTTEPRTFLHAAGNTAADGDGRAARSRRERGAQDRPADRPGLRTSVRPVP